MKVVDAVQVHIFCVPGEGCFPHAKVEIWSVDPLDGHTTVLLDDVQDGVQVPNVPFLHILQY